MRRAKLRKKGGFPHFFNNKVYRTMKINTLNIIRLILLFKQRDLVFVPF